MAESELSTLLGGLFSAQEAPVPREFVHDLKDLTPVEKGNALTRAILFGLGNPGWANLVFSDLVNRVDEFADDDGNPTIEFATKGGTWYDVIHLGKRLARIMGVEGYTNHEQVRQQVGAIPPSELAAIPQLGFNKLEILLEGEQEKRYLTHTFGDALTALAYKDDGAILLHAGNSTSRNSQIWKFTDRMLRKAIGYPENGPSPKIVNCGLAAQLPDRNGNGYEYRPIRRWSELVDLNFLFTFAARTWLDVFNDTFEQTRSPEGGYATSHNRKHAGYWNKYAILAPQALPHCDMRDVHAGLLSARAEKALVARASAELSAGLFGGADEVKRRSEKIREELSNVMIYFPKFGKSDIYEADMILRELGRVDKAGNTVTGEMIRQKMSEKHRQDIPVPHLVPFDYWKYRIRDPKVFEGVDFSRAYRAFNMPDEEINSIPKDLITGSAGLKVWLGWMGSRGVASYLDGRILEESGTADVRMAENVLRYEGKSMDTNEAVQQIVEDAVRLVGTIDATKRDAVPWEKIRAAEEKISKALEGDVHKFQQVAEQGKLFSYIGEGVTTWKFYDVITGILRQHEVPQLSDKEPYVMYDRERFIKTIGGEIAATKLRFTDLAKLAFQNQDRSRRDVGWYLREFYRAGCWMSRDGANFDNTIDPSDIDEFPADPGFYYWRNEKGIIEFNPKSQLKDLHGNPRYDFLNFYGLTSSGREMFKTATVGEISKAMGEDLNKLMSMPLGEPQRRRIEHLRKVHDGLISLGRYSLQMLKHEIALGKDAVTDDLLEQFENFHLITPADKALLIKDAENSATANRLGVTQSVWGHVTRLYTQRYVGALPFLSPEDIGSFALYYMPAKTTN